MAYDEFDLSPDLNAEPLDINQFGGTPPFVPQQPSSPFGGMFDKEQAKRLAPLAMILPIVAKRGGMGAIAAILQGFQQGQARKQQQGRLTAQDQRLAAQDERAAASQRSLDEYRDAQIANMEAQRRAGYLKQFEGALGDIDDPAALEHLVNLYGAQGQAFGVDRNALQQYASAAAPPTTLQKRKAQKTIAELEKRHGQKWIEAGAQFQYDQGDKNPDGTPRLVSLDELLQRVGTPRDPNVPAQAPTDPFEGNTSEKVHLLAYARRHNKTVAQLTDTEILQATKAYRQADDRGPDPLLNEIRSLTAANLRAQQQAVASGAMAPAQFQQAQALGNDYVQETKNFWTQRSAYQQLVSANPAQDSPAGHMALVFAYMKLLDPNSVVRETEYANAQNASAVPDRIRNLYNKVVDGAILTPRQIADFKNQARQIYLGAKTGAAQVKAIYDQRATAQGLPPNAVTYMLDDPAPAAGTSPGKSPAATPPRKNPFRP